MRKSSFIILIALISVIGCKKNERVQVETLTDKKDISYGSAPDYLGNTVSANHTLDIYYPSNATSDKKYPLFFFIHGGGFLVGDKVNPEAQSTCNAFSDSGYIAVSINYRLGYPNSGDPSDCTAELTDYQKAVYRAAQDANAAMRFLISKANEYAIDTSKIFVGGNSAGAGTAINMVYLTQQYCNIVDYVTAAQLGGLHTSVNNIAQAYSIKGIYNGWGIVTDSTLINATNAVPTISFHGTNDRVSPVDNGYMLFCTNYPTAYGSLNIHRQLKRLNVPVKTHILTGGGHGPDEYKYPFNTNESICFFNRVIKRQNINSAIYYGMASGCK